MIVSPAAQYQFNRHYEVRRGKSGDWIVWFEVLFEKSSPTGKISNQILQQYACIYMPVSQRIARNLGNKKGEVETNFSNSVSLGELFSNQFLHDLDLIWELHELIPDPSNPRVVIGK